jgi:uncharacterized protein with HEPN domain
MKRDPKVYIEDAIRACRNIQQFTYELGKDRFISDLKTQSAVERQFEVLGEALNRIKIIDRKILDNIDDWKEIIGFRNIIAHGYDVVEHELVWETIVNDIPVLIRQLEDVFENID